MKVLEHPYGTLAGGQWLRGNLHTHTQRSDGAWTPQEAIAAYRQRGYDFLMLSDHDVLAGEELFRELDDHGLILVPGNEISGAGPHILHVQADRAVPPYRQRQQVFNEAAQAGGFTIVCHPNWYANFNHCRLEQMEEWYGYLGMEIYNGVIRELDGSPYATNKWDILLSEGRRIWGFANDDAHGAAHLGYGWNCVYARERTLGGVVEAMTLGRFYASTGVTITNIQVSGMRIRLETENAERIVALRNTARRFAVADAHVLEVEVPEDAGYVRFECWGRGEQFAWTQPFWLVPD